MLRGGAGMGLNAAMKEAGILEETAADAANRIWRETNGDPLETMRRMEEWALQRPIRVIQIIGQSLWRARLRTWLCTDAKPRLWRHGRSFAKALNKISLSNEAVRHADWWQTIKNQPGRPPSLLAEYRNAAERKRRERIRKGIKAVRAEVNTHTGAVKLIDKEYGPFKHIRINGLPLAEVTTEDALIYAERRDADGRFIRAVCERIPDPRRPIGEQWTPEIIRYAREIAEQRTA